MSVCSESAEDVLEAVDVLDEVEVVAAVFLVLVGLVRVAALDDASPCPGMGFNAVVIEIIITNQLLFYCRSVLIYNKTLHMSGTDI